jgi:pyridinium-3,5-biscarboxylic acid mononucleotide synthase
MHGLERRQGVTQPANRDDRVSGYSSDLEALLTAVASGSIEVADAVARLRHLPFSDLGFARVDHHRALRQGVLEVVYAPGKSRDQLVAIVTAQLENEPTSVVVSRLAPADAAVLRDLASQRGLDVEWREPAGLLAIPRAVPERRGRLLVLTAGTSDLVVAKEAETVAALLGADVRLVADVGVAGLHRLLAEQQAIDEADAIVVVAGMDAALTSVVGGLARVPVIACPTSVGYGATFGGLSALLAMLVSCAPGVAVVNIDDGVGAGTIGALIARGSSGGIWAAADGT